MKLKGSRRRGRRWRRKRKRRRRRRRRMRRRSDPCKDLVWVCCKSMWPKSELADNTVVVILIAVHIHVNDL
jgi:hypothetical protein